eukprot:324524_1
MGTEQSIVVCDCGAQCVGTDSTESCARCSKSNSQEDCIVRKCTSCGKLLCDDHGEIYKYDSSKIFAQGMCRYAFKASNSKGEDVIVKTFKEKLAYDEKDWQEDIKCYNKAIEFIDEWNKLDLINKKYVMHKPKLLASFSKTCDKLAGKFKNHEYEGFDGIGIAIALGFALLCGGHQYVLIEKLLEGDWEKWNSNSGWVSNQNLSVQAFCHWTYHHSKGKLLFCDAQGVRGENNYYITDPAILSVDGSYGMTDIGQTGIEQWFGCHKCNMFCNKNWLKPAKTKASFPITKNSTYRWKTGFK